MNNMLIVDGNSLLCECYYGTVPREVLALDRTEWNKHYHKFMRTRSGTITNGIFTAMGKLEEIIRRNGFTHIAVCVDHPEAKNTRRKLYPDYKGNREKPDESLISQLQLFPRILSEMGIAVFRDSRYEADDLIGSLAARFCRCMPVTVLSGDQDLTQLVRPGVRMWYTCKDSAAAQNLYDDYIQGRDDTVSLRSLNIPDKIFPLTEASVFYLTGVRFPVQIPDLKALAGDSSDNYPGVAGIGKKGAAALLSHFENIEELFETVKKLAGEEPRKIKEFKKDFLEKTGTAFPWKALTAPDAEENARLFKKIAVICQDIPFDGIQEDSLKLRIDMKARERIYRELEFFSLLNRSLT